MNQRLAGTAEHESGSSGAGRAGQALELHRARQRLFEDVVPHEPLARHRVPRAEAAHRIAAVGEFDIDGDTPGGQLTSVPPCFASRFETRRFMPATRVSISNLITPLAPAEAS
jgi:hypothetical protein